MHSLVLEFCRSHTPHTKEAIAKVMFNVIKKCVSEDKVSAVRKNNAADVVLGMGLLHERLPKAHLK